VAVLAKEDVQVPLHTHQTMAEKFQLCEGDIVVLNCLDRGMHLPTFPLAVIRQRSQKNNTIFLPKPSQNLY
jgi:hypothetical protein